MIDFLNDQWLFALILFAILFLGNRYLSKLSGKFYETYARQHIIFSTDEESNPNRQKGVKGNPFFSERNVYPVLSVVLLVVFRLLYGKQLFEFFYGAILLFLVCSILRNAENVIQFLDMSKPNNVVGQIEYSHLLVLRASALDLFSQSILLGIAALVTLRPFFWGGTILCLVIGFRDFFNAKQTSLPK